MNVVLVLRTGGDFNLNDVDLLVHHLRYRYKGKSRLNIYCLHNGLNEKSKFEMNGYTLLPMSVDWPKWWSKINLFSPALNALRPFIYFDLDTAVVRDWDEAIVSVKSSNAFITLENFYHRNNLASGVMWIPDNHKMDSVFTEFAKYSEKYMKSFKGDQNFISSIIKPDLFFQDYTNKFTTFKPYKKGWLTEIPKEVSFVCFHGKPRIHEAKSVEWVNQYIHKNL